MMDAYLAELEEPKRSTLENLRRSILEVIPDAAECISYGVPAFRVRGKVIAGFAAFKNHLSYLPHRQSQHWTYPILDLAPAIVNGIRTDIADEFGRLLNLPLVSIFNEDAGSKAVPNTTISLGLIHLTISVTTL